MDEHLKTAAIRVAFLEDQPRTLSSLYWWMGEVELTLKDLLLHLEAQNPPAETQQSEQSSAPTTGLAIRRYGSAIANLDTRWGSYLLTVETGGSFKSISCTSDEWAAIRQFFLTPQQIHESLTPSIVTQEDGGRGAASPEPASSDFLTIQQLADALIRPSPAEDASREGRE